MKDSPVLAALLVWCSAAFSLHAQTTGLTYQGRLADGASPAHGLYDLRFTLHDAANAGTQIGALTNSAVAVSNGLFVTTLDFGAAAFQGGSNRWLQISARTNGAANFVALNPRQAITPTPLAIFAANAASAGANSVNSTALQDNSVTGAKIANGQVVRSLNNLRDNVVLVPGANVTLATNGQQLVINAAAGAASNAWALTGNSGLGATNFIGTRDNTPLELRVNNGTALRILPDVYAPTFIFGSNTLLAPSSPGINSGSVLGGGSGNVLHGNDNFLGAGSLNRLVGDGYGNFLAAGADNVMTNTIASFLAAGFANRMTNATASAVIAGGNHVVNGSYSAAGGANAIVQHNGSFVWSDLLGSVATTTNNQFLVRASGGVKFDSGLSGFSINGLEIRPDGLGATRFGTTNNTPVELMANNVPALRLSTLTDGFHGAGPSVLAGSPSNRIDNASVLSATVLGGSSLRGSNYVGSSFSTVAGGLNNAIGSGAMASIIGAGSGHRVLTSGSDSVIAAGQTNTVARANAFVGAGSFNNNSSPAGAVVAGLNNTLSGSASFIGAGSANSILGGTNSAVVGGENNYSEGANGFIGAGVFNYNSSANGAVLAGESNEASGTNTAVIAGRNNLTQTGATDSFIGAGSGNRVLGNVGNGAIAAGAMNALGANNGFVGAGRSNNLQAAHGAIVAGASNFIHALSDFSFLGAGFGNRMISGDASFIGAGISNSMGNVPAGAALVAGMFNSLDGSDYAFLGAGLRNHISAPSRGSVIVGGVSNSITFNTAEHFIGGGKANRVTGGQRSFIGAGVSNSVSGENAAVPGGERNSATGDNSFAAGTGARASLDRTFVWSDGSTPDFSSSRAHEFALQATGGVRIVTAGAGVTIDGARVVTSATGISNYARLDAAQTFTGGTNKFNAVEANTAVGGGVAVRAHAGSGTPGHIAAAVYAESTVLAGNGIVGVANNGPNAYGIWGKSTSGFAGYFDGKVQVNGDAIVRVLTITGGADLAEPFATREETLAKGSVVVIDPEQPGQLRQSTSAYDKKVAGIISGANGINPGLRLSQSGVNDSGQDVALSGRVYVLATSANGVIEPGDLLTTSDLPGHAMKVTDHSRAQGAVLGKAMSSLADGEGMVLVLVTLQ
jgi:hypothetical protein